jgi:phosphoenolpyruvate carboxykinase (ATP)
MDVFNLKVPTSCPGVDPKVLDPINTWESKEEYKATVTKLAKGFKKNFERYAKETGQEVINAGPKI